MGTAPEQKTESAKRGLNVAFKPLFYKCIFDFISARASPCPTSLLCDNLSTARFSHFIKVLKMEYDIIALLVEYPNSDCKRCKRYNRCVGKQLRAEHIAVKNALPKHFNH